MGRRFKSVPPTPLTAALKDLRKTGKALLLFSLCLNLLLLTSPIYMMQVFDRVLSSGRSETLLFLTMIAVIAMAVLGALETARGQVLSRAAIWLERRISPDLIAASLRVRLMGEPVSAQALRDLDNLRAFATGAGVIALCDAPWAPIFLLILTLMNPWLGVLGLVGALLLFSLAVINEQVSRAPLKREVRQAISDREAVDQALKNAEALQAMGMLKGFLARWSEQNTGTLAAQLESGERSGSVVGLSKFLRLTLQLLILALGALLVLNHHLTSGGMIAASIILGRALSPVEQSIGAWKGFVAARQAYERLTAIFVQAASVKQPMRLPQPKGRLSCEALIYVPPRASEPVLRGVEFMIEPGEALGIIGPSASGKSTLCRLLMGVWQPTRGHVRLDGADLGNWAPDQLGQHVGYLPQDVELFAGSIKDNIARLNPEPDPAKVVEAAQLAGVHDMILGLPDGYEADIGAEGHRLSGGQRQRIGLARALYDRPRLIVLDEPNANLDNAGERALMEAIEVAKSWGATIVLVAHQPGILRPMDKLLLLVEGQIRYFGPRDQFMGSLHAVQSNGPQPNGPAPAIRRPVRAADVRTRP
jgi:PrtD family type I secretion system ABC transporter